jgi:hypothetical protein
MLVMNEAVFLSGSGSKPKLLRPGVYDAPGVDSWGMLSVLALVRRGWVKQIAGYRHYRQKSGAVHGSRKVFAIKIGFAPTPGAENL